MRKFIFLLFGIFLSEAFAFNPLSKPPLCSFSGMCGDGYCCKYASGCGCSHWECLELCNHGDLIPGMNNIDRPQNGGIHLPQVSPVVVEHYPHADHHHMVPSPSQSDSPPAEEVKEEEGEERKRKIVFVEKSRKKVKSPKIDMKKLIEKAKKQAIKEIKAEKKEKRVKKTNFSEKKRDFNSELQSILTKLKESLFFSHFQLNLNR